MAIMQEGEKRMSIQLKPEQEQRIADALRSGAYGSEDEVIDRALDALREQDGWLSAYRTAIDEKIGVGIAEMERGEGIPEDQLNSHLARLKATPE
jgi:putative addiction module CopG family antidote